MTMVPAPKLSKPHLVFYGACGGGSGAASEVMSRFGGGGGGGVGSGGYDDVSGNDNASPTTADNIIINTTTNIITTFAAADADAFINGGNINNKVDDEDNDTNNNNNNNKNFIRCVLGSDLAIRHPNNNSTDEQQQQQQQSRHSNNNSSINNDDDEGSVDVHLQPANSIKITDTLMIDNSSWLQLGLGGVGGGGGSGIHLDTPLQPLQHHQQSQPESAAVSSGLMLDLNLGGGGGHKTTPFPAPEGRSVTGPTTTPSTTTFISPNHHHHLISSQLYFLQQQQQIAAGCWGFNNQRTTAGGLNSTGCCSSPSSSSSFQQPVFVQSGGAPTPFLTRPFTPSMDTPDSEFRRLIQPPPRRPHSGIWFALYASLHQSKEPFLPQLPKHFLRIKDGRMTVRLVMKYVANKLGLDCESEVEIKCRGQQLVPNLTLQHVRDNIWSPREAHVTVTLLPDSSTSDHVMVLHYGRTLPYSPYLPY